MDNMRNKAAPWWGGLIVAAVTLALWFLLG